MKIKYYKKKFEGTVKNIVKQTATIEFERLIFYPKYERFAKDKTRIHARIPEELMGKIKINDLVEIAECKPLSRVVHHIVINVKIKKH